MQKERVVVGMSGGVDSSVAAWLLKEQGFEVVGLFMKNWEDDDDDEFCASRQDLIDAVSVADLIGVDIETVNFSAEYKDRVFNNFLAEYQAGRTPNPDVLCNREIKFGLCLRYAQRLGASWFATGHYARLRQASAGPELLRARDSTKDQSYFLCAVARAQFAQVQFPLGELEKAAVRERARRAGLPVFEKPDSTGICFIGERPFAEFLARYIPATPGPIESGTGQRLGTHRGLPFYTLGQRGGLEIGGVSGGSGDPWYVARKDPARNALIVIPARERETVTASALRTGAINWLNTPPESQVRVSVKTRYRQADQAATLEPQPDGSALIRFSAPQWAMTPGQTAALYCGERCVGGGVIEETL